MEVIEEESSSENDRKSPEAATAGASYNADGYQTASDTETQEDARKRIENLSHSNDTDVSCVDGFAHGEDSASGGVKAEESLEKAESIGREAIEKVLMTANDAISEGNALFRSGLYEEALLKYAFAIQIAPEGSPSIEVRSMCFTDSAVCFFKLGKYEETIEECTKALELNPHYIKAILRRAEAHEKLEHYEESMADMKKILDLDPWNDYARKTIIRLKPLADEKREKMKEEMMVVAGRTRHPAGDGGRPPFDPNTGWIRPDIRKRIAEARQQKPAGK